MLLQLTDDKSFFKGATFNFGTTLLFSYAFPCPATYQEMGGVRDDGKEAVGSLYGQQREARIGYIQ